MDMATDHGWHLVFAVIGTFTVLVSFKLDVRLLLLWGIYGLLALALLTFILNSLGPRVLSWWYQIFPKPPSEDQGLPEEELVSQKESHRDKAQQDYTQKATKYNEDILKPREEAKREQEEREFYHFTGPAWKGKGKRLGQPGEDESPDVKRRQRVKGSGKDAALVRKLPESATKAPPQPQKEEKTKRVIILPDEPDEGTPQSITVAMRGVTGTVTRRRFLYTDLVKSVLDWMTKKGYHPQLYTLCTTYPKQDLYHNALHTLQEVGIDKDTLLVVEERDEKLSEEELIEWE